MHQPRIVIIGAGIVGLSTAYALLRQGIRSVTVLEQASVDHARSTSGGLSRLLRFEYGTEGYYSEMVRLSLARWQRLEQVSGRSLYTQTGVLLLGDEQDNFTLPSYFILKEMGFHPELLTRQTCTQRFPQFDTTLCNVFMYNTAAGMLSASICLRTLAEVIGDLGGRIYEETGVTHIDHDNPQRPIRLTLNSGDQYTADRVVLAAGPWIQQLLDEVYIPIYLTRQYMLYFSHLPETLFRLHTFPAFMAPSLLVGDLYGFPLYHTCAGSGPAWFKATSHSFGMPITPDEEPLFNLQVIAYIRDKLCKLIPALRQADLVQTDACIYDVSQDEAFILDTVAGDPRVVFASGLSGHGFKFGPLLGELLSSMVCEEEAPSLLQHFHLARFT